MPGRRAGLSRAAGAALAVVLVVAAALAYGYLSRRPAATTYATTTASARPTTTATASVVLPITAPPPKLAEALLANGTLRTSSPYARELWAALRPLSCNGTGLAQYLRWLTAELQDPQSLMTQNYTSMIQGYFGSASSKVKTVIAPLGLLNDVNASPCFARVGVVRLPYGVGVVITAFYDPELRSVVVAVQDTVVDPSQFANLLFAADPLQSGTGALSAVEFFENRTGLRAYALWTTWVLNWPVPGTDVYYELPNGTTVLVPVTAVGVIELPQYFVRNVSYPAYETDYYALEMLEWDMVEPAIAVLADFGLPYSMPLPSPSPPQLAQQAISLTANVLGGQYIAYIPQPGEQQVPLPIPGIVIEPFTTPLTFVEEGGGVCGDFAEAYSAFASNALGAPTIYVDMIVYSTGESHGVALIALPNYTGPAPYISAPGYGAALPSYDGEPINLSAYGLKNWVAYKLADTAALPAQMIENMSDVEGYVIEPPLMYALNWQYNGSPQYFAPLYALTNVPQAVLSLPPWLQTPWLRAFGNLTEGYLEAYGHGLPKGFGSACIVMLLNDFRQTYYQQIMATLSSDPALIVPPGYTPAVLGLPTIVNLSGMTVTYQQLYQHLTRACNFAPPP